MPGQDVVWNLDARPWSLVSKKWAYLDEEYLAMGASLDSEGGRED